MKRKPTLRQKLMLLSRNLKPEDWLVRKAPGKELHIEHRHLPKVRRVVTPRRVMV